MSHEARRACSPCWMHDSGPRRCMQSHSTRPTGPPAPSALQSFPTSLHPVNTCTLIFMAQRALEGTLLAGSSPRGLSRCHRGLMQFGRSQQEQAPNRSVLTICTPLHSHTMTTWGDESWTTVWTTAWPACDEHQNGTTDLIGHHPGSKCATLHHSGSHGAIASCTTSSKGTPTLGAVTRVARLCVPAHLPPHQRTWHSERDRTRAAAGSSWRAPPASRRHKRRQQGCLAHREALQNVQRDLEREC